MICYTWRFCLFAPLFLLTACVPEDYNKAVELALTKRYGEAVVYYRAVAQQGYAPAQLRLGEYYLSGRGVEKDLIMAERWFEKAYDNGNHGAIARLAALYQQQKNYDKSVQWLNTGLAVNDSESIYLLGQSYEQGLGVALDFKRAIELYRRASIFENSKARIRLSELVRAGVLPEEVLASSSITDKIYHSLQNPVLFIVLLVLNLPLYLLLVKSFFTDLDALIDHVRWLMRRDKDWDRRTEEIISGEYTERTYDNIRFISYIVFCLALVTIEYKLVGELFF